MSHMRRIGIYLLMGWGFSLLIGCGAGVRHHQTTSESDYRQARADSGKKARRRNRNRHASAGGDTRSLKGKGSSTEQVSRNVTAQKMESWNVTAEKVQAVAPIVAREAAANDLPPSLILGIIWVESRFNPEAVSPVGARGLMQLMPKTAAYLAECMKWEGRADSFDPEFNIAAGSYYIARLIKQFDGDLDLALAAYNAGAGNIRKWMNNTGLPEVSIEYYTMVQTAQKYFPSNESADPETAPSDAFVPSSDDLDRLGLAILIAGLSQKEFGLQRPDDANPFGDM